MNGSLRRFTEFPLARFLSVQSLYLCGLEAVRIREVAAREAQSWVVSSLWLAMSSNNKVILCDPYLQSKYLKCCDPLWLCCLKLPNPRGR